MADEFIEAVVKRLGWSDEEARKYLDLYEGHVPMACLELDAFVDDKWQLEYFHAYAYRRILMETGIDFPSNVLNEASPLELRIMATIVPHYAFYAFKVPYTTCTQLATVLKLSLSKHAVAYGAIYQQLLVCDKLSLSECERLIRDAGVDPDSIGNICTLRPFGDDILDGHVFEHVDIGEYSPASLKQFMEKSGDRLARIREKKTLENQICRENGMFTFKNDKAELVKGLKKLLGSN